jgi:hypothetical protein
MAGSFEFGQGIIPPVFIDRVILEPGSDESLTNMFIDMSIQDMLDNEETSWFFQEEFLKFLKIKILLSNSSEDTEMILTQDLSQIVKNLNDNEISDDNITIKVKPNLPKDSKEKVVYPTPVESSNGDLIYRIPIQYIFKDLNLTEHLSVFVYAFVDLRAISDDFGLNVPDDTFVSSTYGEISGETVLNDGKVISSSTVFFTTDPNGTQLIWTGPVRYDDEKNEYYAADTNPRKILQKTSIPNYKVQDFRSTRAGPAFLASITEQTQDAFKDVQHRLLNGTTLNFGLNTDNFCSPGTESSDKGGIITTYFDLDFKNLLQSKSLFGSLMEGPSNEDVLKNSRITELKIYRRRVKRRNTNSRLNTTIDDLYVFDKNQPWELVAITGEPKDQRFISMSKYYGASYQKVEQNLIGSIVEIAQPNSPNQSEIRTFEIKDYTLKKKTYGLYQYGIELKIQDGTVIFLQKILNKLSSTISGLNNYYTFSTSRKFYNPLTRRFNQDLVDLYSGDQQDRPWENAVEAYVEALEKLTYSSRTNKYGTEEGLLTPAEKSEIAIELNNLANPSGGTPEGVALLISLLENLEDLILKTLQGKTRIINQQPDSNQSEIYHRNNYERFVINYSHFLSSYVDSDFPDGTGIQVLPTESPTLYVGKFKTRTEQETLKYFNYKSPENIQKNMGKVPGLNDENKGISDVRESFYTFFTPMKITVGGQDLELQNKGNANWENSSYERFTSFLLQTGDSPKISIPSYSSKKTGNSKVSSKNSSKAPSLENVQSLENLLSDYSVTISTTMEENKTTTETIASNPPDSSMTFDDSTIKRQNKIYDEFLIKNVSDVARIFTSLAVTNNGGRNKNSSNKNKQPTTKPTIKNYNLTTNENLIDTSVRKSAIKKGQLEKLPNQISSLFLSQSPAVKNNWQNYEKQGIDFVSNNQTDLMFLYNYSTLFRVQFQDGYQKDKNGKPLLNQPIWKDLTEKEIERVEKSEVLMCKLSKYNNPEIGVEYPELLDLPIFDKHFLLAKDKSTLDRAKSPPPKKAKKIPSYKKVLKKANKTGDFKVSQFSKGLIRKGK